MEELTATVEVGDSHPATVGHTQVRRALPRHGRRTVGAWCFADHMEPAQVTATNGLDIGPHPHCGLQTVTWLTSGEALHHDSLGTEQLIRPGQLNLMTAGHGVAHSEEATGHYEGRLEGIQLWVALPETTREEAAAFEHHAQLPRLEVNGVEATVLVGEFAGATSPARHDSSLVGVDLNLRGAFDAAANPRFEYAVIVMAGALTFNATRVAEGQIAYVGPGLDTLSFDAPDAARGVLLGGEPFESPVLMWWNFVARTREEIDRAYESWANPDGRFGDVASLLARIETVPPWWKTPSG